MNQPTKGGEIHPLCLHLTIEELGKLILEVKVIGDRLYENLKIATVLSRLSLTRLVALCDTGAVLFFLVEQFLRLNSYQANYLRPPDERSEKASQRVEGEATAGKDQEDEKIEYRIYQSSC
jgi:hypothetical protein